MFASLYQLFLGVNDDPTYEETIFGTVGLVTVLTSIGLAAIFYLLINRWKSVFNGRIHWIILLFLVMILGFTFAVMFSKAGTEMPMDNYMIVFGVVNLFFAALIFFLVSILFKRWSIFAKNNPF